MTPGMLPFAAPPPASLFAPLLRRSAQKVTKKARHRTRCFDSHPANQNPLCFSARRGCSDNTSLYCFAIAARLRCSAPRTAPLIHESVHPCTTLMQTTTHRTNDSLPLRQDAADTGPTEARRGCAGRVRRRPRTMRGRSLNVHGCTSTNPVAPSRTWRADGMDAGGRATREQLPDARKARRRGCVSLVTFLCTSTAPQERREQRSWRQRREGQDARSHAKK
jgi:hypothetical protein